MADKKNVTGRLRRDFVYSSAPPEVSRELGSGKGRSLSCGKRKRSAWGSLLVRRSDIQTRSNHTTSSPSLGEVDPSQPPQGSRAQGQLNNRSGRSSLSLWLIQDPEMTGTDIRDMYTSSRYYGTRAHPLPKQYSMQQDKQALEHTVP